MLNAGRKQQLIQVLTDLDCLPAYYPDDAEVLVKAAKTPNDKLLIALLDMSLDPLEDLPLVIRRPVSSIKKLCADGTYCDVAFTAEGERYTLDLTANVFDPVILVVE